MSVTSCSLCFHRVKIPCPCSSARHSSRAFPSAASRLQVNCGHRCGLCLINLIYLTPEFYLTSCFPWNLKELCSFFLLRCEMGSTCASTYLTLTFDLTLALTWFPPSMGLPWATNGASPLQISLLNQLFLPSALIVSLRTAGGLACLYFCYSYKTPCGAF